MAFLSTQLVGDLALGAAGTWTDVLSLVLPIGDYLIIGQVCLTTTGNQSWSELRIHDGTNVVWSGEERQLGPGLANSPMIFGQVSLLATVTVKLQVRWESTHGATSCTARANTRQTSQPGASHMLAISDVAPYVSHVYQNQP